MTSLFIYYYDWAGSWKVDLGGSVLRLGDIAGLTELADNGDAGSSGLRFDDPNANIGHSSDAITGLKFIGLDEMACAVGNRRLYTAMIGDRKYHHSTNPDGSLRLGSARIVDVDLQEVNTILRNRTIRPHDSSAKRPSETPGDRLTWILGSQYLTDLVVDGGLVVYPPAPTMDATNYQGQGPAEVLVDVALATGYTFFLYHDDERWQKARLWFDDFLRSDTYASTLRLSNVLADRDSSVETGVGATGTFASGPATLIRSPERVFSGVDLPYRKGTVHERDANTASSFIERDGSAPNANVKSEERARVIAQRFLNNHDTEYDQITTTVELPVAQVNSIRRGHLISGKWSHLPGYTSFTELRVLQRTISSTKATDDRYTLGLTLTPTRVAPTCDPDLADNLALTATVVGYTDGPTGGTTNLAAPTNPTNVNDGNDATSSVMVSTLIGGAYTGQTFHRGWSFSWGGTQTIGYIDVRKVTSDTYPNTFEYYDGSWHTLNGTIDGFNDGTVGVQRLQFTPISCTGIRITFSVFCGGGLPFGFSYDGSHAVDEIRILGCAI